ncbi:uncharacterized protein LOC129216259 isoform X2 [Uloborus diversus]|nr:uncharacterized protein LOC129216259 isoform X2 [Uloborus diversus]
MVTNETLLVTDGAEFITLKTERNLSSSSTEHNLDHGLTSEVQVTEELHEDHETTTEATGIDELGCDRDRRRKYERKCEAAYEMVSDKNEDIRNDEERKEAKCCSMEDYEKCVLQALDRSNCGHHKPALRTDLQATRLLMNVISNITCTEYRGKCGSYPSAGNPTKAGVNYVIMTLIFGILFS